jgi:hypothetical protein
MYAGEGRRRRRRKKIWNVNSERWWLWKKTSSSSSSVPPKLKIQEYSTLLCFDRIQTFWHVMMCQWMSGFWHFAGLWCLHFQGSSCPRRIAVFLGLLTLKTQASQSFKTLGNIHLSPSNTVAHSGRLQSLAWPLWQPGISHSYILYHTAQCLVPHYSSPHSYFVSWGTVFRLYVRNWNTAAISLCICCSSCALQCSALKAVTHQS